MGPTCNPCSQKYLLKRNKLFDLHRDKLLEQMNNKVGGPVIPLKPPLRKTKPQLTPGNRKQAQAWSNPKNTNIGDIIGLALKQYKKDNSPTEGQTINKKSKADTTQTTNPSRGPPKDETFNMIEVSTLSETDIGNTKNIPNDNKTIEVEIHREDTNPNRDTTMLTPDEQAKSPHCTPKVAVTNPTKRTKGKANHPEPNKQKSTQYTSATEIHKAETKPPDPKTERDDILPPDETVNQQNETIAPIPHKDESIPQTPHLEGDYWITTIPDKT